MDDAQARPAAAHRDISSPSPSSSIPRKKKACQYCFRRKMKCDLLSPRCTNCVTQDKECIPATRAVRPRPTHEQIDQLHETITRQRRFIQHLATLPPEAVAQAVQGFDDSSTEWDRGGSAGPVLERSGRRRSTTRDGRSASPARGRGYPYGDLRGGRINPHGPTSALFETADRDFGAQPTLSDESAVSETELVEAATQRCAEERQLEVINLAAGKLDFDGVAPDLAMHLLALHWNRQHFAFMVSYRPLFTRDMASGGPYFSRLLLNAIFFSVSKFSDRPEVYDNVLNRTSAGNQFLRRVKELLGEAVDQSSVPTIQAMLLLSNSLFAIGRHSPAWLYSGIAVQMIFDLGLNYDQSARVGLPGGITAEEFEIRRRVVWAAFIIDKIISLYQGRPVSFDEDRMHVPHRFLDWYEEQELWMPFAFPANKPYPGRPARAISTFTALCSLSVLMGRIITQIYAERSLSEPAAEVLERLSASLFRWKESLVDEIRVDPTDTSTKTPPPHVLSLHMVYYALVTLLHRPFVESGHHRHSDPGMVEVSWSRCEDAARSATLLLSLYRSTFTLARAPYLISYTTFVAATIHVRIAAQRGVQSEAARLLLICLEGLKENSVTNAGVLKMYTTILALMERMHVDLPSPSTIEFPALTGEAVLADLDLNAVINSFGTSLPVADINVPPLSAMYDADGELEQQDNLYGFLGLLS